MLHTQTPGRVLDELENEAESKDSVWCRAELQDALEGDGSRVTRRQEIAFQGARGQQVGPQVARKQLIRPQGAWEQLIQPQGAREHLVRPQGAREQEGKGKEGKGPRFEWARHCRLLLDGREASVGALTMGLCL